MAQDLHCTVLYEPTSDATTEHTFHKCADIFNYMCTRLSFYDTFVHQEELWRWHIVSMVTLLTFSFFKKSVLDQFSPAKLLSHLFIQYIGTQICFHGAIYKCHLPHSFCARVAPYHHTAPSTLHGRRYM